MGGSRQLSDFGHTDCRNSVALQVREIRYGNHKEAYVSCVGERDRAWKSESLSLRCVSRVGKKAADRDSALSWVLKRP